MRLLWIFPFFAPILSLFCTDPADCKCDKAIFLNISEGSSLLLPFQKGEKGAHKESPQPFFLLIENLFLSRNALKKEDSLTVDNQYDNFFIPSFITDFSESLNQEDLEGLKSLLNASCPNHLLDRKEHVKWVLALSYLLAKHPKNSTERQVFGKDALFYLRQAQSIVGDDECALMLADLYFDQGNPSLAIQCLEDIKEKRFEKELLLLRVHEDPEVLTKFSNALIAHYPDLKGKIHLIQAYCLDELSLKKGEDDDEFAIKASLDALKSYRLFLLEANKKDSSFFSYAMGRFFHLLERHHHRFSQEEVGSFITSILERPIFLELIKEQRQFLTALIAKDQTLYDLLEKKQLVSLIDPIMFRFLQASKLYEEGNYKAAEAMFFSLALDHPDSKEGARSLFFSALCLIQQDKESSCSRKLLTQFLEKEPNSSLKEEALYRFYSPIEYQSGDKDPINHLKYLERENLAGKYRPLVLFLLALQGKRENIEGKKIQVSEGASLAYFQEIIELYQSQKDPLFEFLYENALYEEGLLHERIAKRSKGAKKKLHGKLACKNYEEIMNSLSFEWRIQGALSLGALTCSIGDREGSKKIYRELLEELQKRKITVSSARALACIGLADAEDDDEEILFWLLEAKKALKPSLLAPSRELDLLMRIAGLYQKKGLYDEALCAYSKVANAPYVSELRLEALYRRAETYILAGQPKLAFLQLKSLAGQGEKWGRLAQEKLKEGIFYDNNR